MDDRPLLHRLDGLCRDDELARPELSELASRLETDAEAKALYRRIQQFDASLRTALLDVPVPEGLAERILAAMQKSPQLPGNSTASPVNFPVEAPAAPTESPRRPAAIPVETSGLSTENNGHGILRFWPAFAGVATVAAMLLLLFRFSTPVEVTRDAALQLALDFHISEPRALGRLVGETPPPKSYPFSDFLIRDNSLRWRHVSGFLGRSGVAYQWGKATLYVVPSRRGARAAAVRIAAPFPSRPSAEPMLTTGGRSVAAWQQKDRIYVLVIDGNRGAYRELFGSSGGQLASTQAARIFLANRLQATPAALRVSRLPMAVEPPRPTAAAAA